MFFLITIAIDPFVIGVYMIAGPSFPAVALAAGVWALSGASLSAIWYYATDGRRLVDRTLTDGYVRRLTEVSVFTPLMFSASIGIALLSPSIAEYFWILGIVGQAVLRRRIGQNEPAHRRRRPTEARSPPDP